MQSLVTVQSAGPGFIVFLYVGLIALNVVAGWRIFVKAGQPGWGIFVPIYNLYLICKIAGRPGWYPIVFLIPVVNILVSLFIAVDIARAFSKTLGFGFGLWILGFVFVPILGLGSAQYRGPVRSPNFEKESIF
jgi:hypothetical protein